MRRAGRVAALTGTAVAAAALSVGALAPAVGMTGAASSAGAAVLPRVTLPQGVPALPSNVARLGLAPASTLCSTSTWRWRGRTRRGSPRR